MNKNILYTSKHTQEHKINLLLNWFGQYTYCILCSLKGGRSIKACGHRWHASVIGKVTVKTLSHVWAFIIWGAFIKFNWFYWYISKTIFTMHFTVTELYREPSKPPLENLVTVERENKKAGGKTLVMLVKGAVLEICFISEVKEMSWSKIPPRMYEGIKV